MRAVTVREPGPPEVLTVSDVADPVPGPDEVLIRVEHSALNRADLSHRAGTSIDLMDQPIPGLEYSGRIAACGSRVTAWAPGDRVMGIERGGCYAELVASHERLVLPTPTQIPDQDAAAIPEAFLTAWDALVVQGGLRSGKWALVHAGASGVGSAAIQIAKALGAFVAVTVSAAKSDACRALGADVVLTRSPEDWVSAAQTQVPGGFDVVLDVIGGEEIERNFLVIREQGTVVQVGLMGGRSVPFAVDALVRKRAHWVGTTLKNRPLEQKATVCQRFIREVLPLFDTGALRPVIDSHFALDDVADAHRHMEANRNVGKIILDVATSPVSPQSDSSEQRATREGTPDAR